MLNTPVNQHDQGTQQGDSTKGMAGSSHLTGQFKQTSVVDT